MVVQANSELYEDGLEDNPAGVIYSLHSGADGRPDVLAEAAETLGQMKGGSGFSPDHQAVADLLAAETKAVLRFDLPIDLSGGLPCILTAMMVMRKFMPSGRLDAPLFPIIAAPQITESVMLLPSMYWDPEFVQRFWSEE